MGSALVSRSWGERLGVVVQMRLDSTRLPRKALLPLGNTSLAGAVLRRLRRIPADAYILATDAAGAFELADLAQAWGFIVFEGPKDDVLARYCLALREHGLDIVLRATGDNPFVSVQLASLLIERGQSAKADYAGFLDMPTGMGVEFVRSKALERAFADSADPYEREHVCPYLYRHPELFRLERPSCPPAWHLPQGRLTVDTEADYRAAQALVSALGDDPDDMDIMDYLRRPGGSASP